MIQQLDDRKQKILGIIIEEYLKTAEPVGSKHISAKYKLGLSPATIRNEMAWLEETGFIIQPHTSAGRIPTDKGYRFYVDKLMKEKELSQKELEFIRGEYEKTKQDSDDIFHETLKILTTLSSYATVITAPSISSSFQSRIYSGGIANILKLPEFRDIGLLEHIIKVIEHEDLLSKIMHEYSSSDGVTVKIGKENKFEDIKNCSVVVTTYQYSETSFGTLGVIGPTRMNYDKTTSLIDSVANELSSMFEEVKND